MARVIWSRPALRDLASITDYLIDRDPDMARQITRRLLALGYSLEDFPNRGRLRGRCRELTTVPPFVLRYSVSDDLVRILSIRHGRRRPLAD